MGIEWQVRTDEGEETGDDDTDVRRPARLLGEVLATGIGTTPLEGIDGRKVVLRGPVLVWRISLRAGIASRDTAPPTTRSTSPSLQSLLTSMT